MARKDLLKGLMGDDDASPSHAPSEARVDAARPRYSGGAIGAVSQQIAELKSRAILEIDADQITGGGLTDRLDDEDEDHRALMQSLRDHGQQVPVLVRPDPAQADRYQIVYGRRRVKALRDLGMPVKALVRGLDDKDMVIAQGQENSARKDLSFIEKASFARQMRDLKYDRESICAALHVDKTVISRMLSVVDRIAPELIEAVGAAPSVGRDRWLALADLMKARSASGTDALVILKGLKGADTSDKRFEGLMQGLSQPKKPRKNAVKKFQLVDEDGGKLGHYSALEDAIVVTIPKDGANGFDRWLVKNMAEIHRRWKEDAGD